ncbi:MAG: cobalamin-dependent protein, partial [Leptospiraceae bacterium]|nr:cobalamin-dependent protein [Leptospiraceae bacterium]
QSAIEENADIIGVSILSGSHVELARQTMDQLRKGGAEKHIPVIFGGIIPAGDFKTLEEIGIRKVFTPSNYELIDIMERVMDIVEEKEAALTS